MRTPFDGVDVVCPHTPVFGAAVIERRNNAFVDTRYRESMDGILS